MLKHMKAHKHLKPGENGTLRLVERFGDALLCVRYRYDAIRDIRIKTTDTKSHSNAKFVGFVVGSST